ncbi:MAG: hypothetical protein GH155_04435 [Spirochaeta sp.]|nr:hypothetical protein [Spirochaeta sp.]
MEDKNRKSVKGRCIVVLGLIMTMGLFSGYSLFAGNVETVRDTVAHLEVGEAVYYEQLTIIPIHSTRIQDYTHYVTLDKALKNKYLQIREIDGGNVPEVMLNNISDKTIYIMGGEILTGCKQDRIVGKDLLIRPKGKEVAERAPEGWKASHPTVVPDSDGPEFEPLGDGEEVSVDARKRAWARLLAKVYEVDPLVCPKWRQRYENPRRNRGSCRDPPYSGSPLKAGRAPPGFDPATLN